MDYCGDCRHINGVCACVGFCDKHFREVRTDRPACTAFGRRKPAKPVRKAPTEDAPTTEPVKEPQSIVETKPVAQQEPQAQPRHKRGAVSFLERLTPVERMYLITAYHHEPMAQIQARFGVSRMCLLRTLKELGVNVRKRGEVTKAGKERQMTGLKRHFAERRTQ